MIPPFAISGAISTIDKVGGGALAGLKHLTSSGQTGGKNDATAASHPFGALLSAQGVDSNSPLANAGTGAIR